MLRVSCDCNWSINGVQVSRASIYEQYSAMKIWDKWTWPTLCFAELQCNPGYWWELQILMSVIELRFVLEFVISCVMAVLTTADWSVHHKRLKDGNPTKLCPFLSQLYFMYLMSKSNLVTFSRVNQCVVWLRAGKSWTSSK